MTRSRARNVCPALLKAVYNGKLWKNLATDKLLTDWSIDFTLLSRLDSVACSASLKKHTASSSIRSRILAICSRCGPSRRAS